MKYSIMQVKDSRKLYLSYANTMKHGGLDLSEYETVYTGEINDGDPLEVCEKLYTIFNTQPPEDYRSRSLSVSDIISLEYTGMYFCDSIGFKKIN